MTDNLELWNKVERTPIEHTKEITGKSYRGNSPKPHYLIRKATETFGPCGIGWGFTIADERVEEGAGGSKVHFARVKVWYEWSGKRGEVEHVGGTEFSGVRASGKTFTDEDAPKKSVTDALVKALSMMGFAGDIFMGRYDDSKYMTELRQEAAEEGKAAKPQPKPACYDKLVAELKKAGMSSDIGRMWRDQEFIDLRSSMSEEWQIKLKDEATAIGNRLKAKEAKLKDTVQDIQDAFPGSKVTDERITDVSGRELEYNEAGE